MKKASPLFILFSLCVIFFSCNKQNDILQETNKQQSNTTSQRITANQATSVTENFETGTKTSYTAGNVTLTTGSWNLNDALIGNSTSDKKNGSQSARIRNSGILTSNFDFTSGVSTVSVAYALYGTDASATWQLWYSTNGGTSYSQAGTTISNASSTLQTTNFTINVAGNIRLQVRKTDGSTNRINIDDITVNPYTDNTAPPVLSSISPNRITAGSAAFTITATGSSFTNTSIINWNGAGLTTTYVGSTTLTATVPAANVSTTGSANVSVSNGTGSSAALVFTITAANSGPKKFLFDATKAETAGNADWTIDEDGSQPQRIPTPAQSTITSGTSETYWRGALSSWGIALVKSGNFVETLSSGTSITYGSGTNAQDLSHYDVFVIDEPNTRFTSSEKTAILNFVRNGGGLFMISDHTISDRNGDGWDSPDIWNDLMNNNSVLNNPFGFSVDLTNISELSSNVLNNSSNPILHGIKGNVTKLEFNNGATLTLQPSVNSNVQGLIWQNGYSQNNTHVMAASSVYGTGRVFMVTDSSPMDDGTGAANNTLFVSWPLYSHTQLFMNASLWLAKLQ